MKPKLIAFYLPQFHSIPENDLWWGKGFTEWDRLRSAKPIFEGHQQPRIPYKYYDLSNVNEMVNQAQLAKRHGIYGFCYYHYWFNGKLLLEKPLEQMLKTKEVDIPFCLSWANEKWTRAWDGKSKEVLIDQEYGDEKNWDEHFSYLLKYFKDDRYIKIEEMPILLIYRTKSFKRFDEMILYWNAKMKENGLKELYIIETLNSYQKKPSCSNSKAIVEFEPMYTIGSNRKYLNKIVRLIKKKCHFLYKNQYKIFDYDKVWNKIVKRNNYFKGKEIYLGAFPDWDNSPRFKEKGEIFKNVSAEKFGRYLEHQISKAQSQFIFINAWNEWAEGAYLEPDNNNGYGFLNEIKRISQV